MRIRTRLLVAYMGIILVGFSGLAVIAGGQITAAVRADYEQRLQNEIRLVARGISSSVDAAHIAQSGDSEVAARLTDFEHQTGGKLTLYLPEAPPRFPDGPPRPDASGGFGGGSFSNMPELETAAHGGTVMVQRNNAAGESTLYTASTVSYNNQIKGLIQLAVPAQNLQDIALQRWTVLGIGFALLTSLALLAALILSRSIITPLDKLRESAMRLSQGDFSHRVTLIRADEIGDVASAFNEMAAQVQSMLEEQRAFASNTSHELLTPLTAIRLRTESLRSDTSLGDIITRQYIEEIDDEIVGLADLVQELTLLSRFDAGRAEIGHDQIDMTRLASTLHQQFLVRYNAKSIEFCLTVPDQQILVTASLSHLTIVFRNLLDNALKYTSSGGKIIWRIEEAECGICHTIQDNGQGISQEHLPHVYERFYRADKARSRDIPGSGLGLALVKSITDIYCAHVTIQSEGAGKGTTVTLCWPHSQNTVHNNARSQNRFPTRPLSIVPAPSQSDP